MGDNEPKTLVSTLVYFFGKFFAPRSAEEPRSLTFAQLEVIEGDRGGVYSTEVYILWRK